MGTPFVLGWDGQRFHSWKCDRHGNKSSEEELFSFVWNGKTYTSWRYNGWTKMGRRKQTRVVRIPDEDIFLYISGFKEDKPILKKAHFPKQGKDREPILVLPSDKPVEFKWNGKLYWVPQVAYREKLDIYLFEERITLKVTKWGNSVSKAICELEIHEPQHGDKAVVACPKRKKTWHKFYPMPIPITIDYFILNTDYDLSTELLSEDFAFIGKDIDWTNTKRNVLIDRMRLDGKFELSEEKHGQIERIALLIDFGWLTENQWLPELLHQLGFVPGNIHDLISLRQNYPDIQKETGVCCLSNEKAENGAFLCCPILHGYRCNKVALWETLQMGFYGKKNDSKKVLGVQPFYFSMRLRDRILAFNP